MVDVSAKAATEREAVAEGRVFMQPATLDSCRKGDAKKGDVLGTARIAGIMAAKKHARTDPALPSAWRCPRSTVDLGLTPKLPGIASRRGSRCCGQTGVEMEALTAVAVACLTSTTW